MKNWIMALVAAGTLSVTVGCDTKSENQKNADKIEDSAKTGDSLALEGISEYNEATKVRDMRELSDAQLEVLKQKYTSARHKFAAAVQHYEKALADAEKYKDGVKTTGKESVQSSIKIIKTTYIEDIDYRLRRIEAYKAERANKKSEN